jgi:CBS domain-containing protein
MVRTDELMSSPAVAVSPEMSIKQAAAVLVANDVTAAPVLDGAGDLVGIVSEADLLVHETPHDPRAHLRLLPDDPVPPPRRVSDVMSTDVTTVSEGADASDAVAIMLDLRVKSVPVLAGGRVVGVISQRDLLRALARDDAEIRGDVEERLRQNVEEPESYRVTVREGLVTVTGHNQRGATALVRTVPGVIRVMWRDAR